MNTTQGHTMTITIDQHDLEDRYVKDLTPIELHFLEETDSHNLNTCNNCGVIKNTWEDLYWDVDHDLKGHTALCNDCYTKLNCQPI